VRSLFRLAGLVRHQLVAHAADRADAAREHRQLPAQALQRPAIENVLNAPVRFTQGEGDSFLANRYLTGQTFWLSLTYTN
jgi:hypothetical protein